MADHHPRRETRAPGVHPAESFVQRVAKFARDLSLRAMTVLHAKIKYTGANPALSLFSYRRARRGDPILHSQRTQCSAVNMASEDREDCQIHHNLQFRNSLKYFFNILRQ
jgi:hypothetical protein